MGAGTITRSGGQATFERPLRSRLPDRLLHGALLATALAVLALIAFFFVRLIDESSPLLSSYGVLLFVTHDEWVPSQAAFGALPLVVGTLVTSAVALVI